MKRNRIMYFLFTILMIALVPVTAKADDTNFNSATASFARHDESKLSDDELIISGIASGTTVTNYSISVSATQETSVNVNDCSTSFSNLIPLVAGSSADKATISAANFKNKVLTLETNNDKLYINVFVDGGASGKCLVKKNMEVKTPEPYQRLADSAISVDHKNTISLDDDVLTIGSAAPLANLSKYTLCFDNTSYGINGNPSDASNAAYTIVPEKCTPLVKSGENYTIANSFYQEKVKNVEYTYATLQYDGMVIRTSTLIDGAKSALAVRNLKAALVGAKTDKQTEIELQFGGVTLDDPSKYIVIFSRKADTKDIISVHGMHLVDGDACQEGIKLEAITGSDQKYGLKTNKDCILKYLEYKQDTYITLYKIMSAGEYEACSVGFACVNESYSFYAKKLTESVQVPRPNDLAVGKRIAMNIEPNQSLFYFNSLSASDKQATYVIGSVTDKELLRNLRDNKSGAYDSLLAYAKKATAINQGTVTITANEASSTGAAVAGEIYSQTEIHAGEYYFVYVKINGDDYYPIEDVQVFGATKNSDGKIELVEKENIEWKGIDETKKTKKNPGTGIASYTLLALSISAAAIIIYIKTRKVTKFPQS